MEITKIFSGSWRLLVLLILVVLYYALHSFSSVHNAHASESVITDFIGEGITKFLTVVSPMVSPLICLVILILDGINVATSNYKDQKCDGFLNNRNTLSLKMYVNLQIRYVLTY